MRTMTRIAALLLLTAYAGCGGDEPSGVDGGLSIRKLGGDEQTGVVATMLLQGPSVEVTNSRDEGVAGVQVRFSITAGSGATSDTIVTTSAAGIATTTWYLGPASAAANGLRAALVQTPTKSVDFTATAVQPTLGSTYFGRNQYIEYIPGDLPIIITAPHGGTLTPTEIPNRAGGVTDRDTNTEELARVIYDRFLARTGRRPHLIICRLRRTKLDANREIVEAAEGNRFAQRAWYEWHAFITAAKYRVSTDFLKGLYMDLHGHGHAISRLELGYLLTSTELGFPDNTLSQQTYVVESSIRALVESTGTPLAQLVRGPFSLGTLFEAKGYSSVPSSSQPNPGSDPYFNGGYNTERHGSRNAGPISGFQLESHFTGVRDTQTSRLNFANALVDVFEEYLNRHFGVDITP